MEQLTFDLNEIFAQQTSDELVKEATAFSTLPSGRYRLAVEKASGQVTPDNFSFPGVQMVHLQVSALAVDPNNTDASGNPRKGKLFVNLCPTILRRDDGRLDSSSKRWGQYQKAVDKIGAPVGEVIEAIKLYPVDAYVAEGFKMPDSSYQFPKNEDEKKAAIAAGGEAKNFVQGIYKVAA
jgi:hypothetical protein